MRRALVLLLVPTFAATVTAVACSDSSLAIDTGDAGGGADAAGPSGRAGTGEATGLPCEVQGVLENRCIACHGEGTAPPLLNYEQLIAKSTKDPSKTRAEVAVDLMKGQAMPPRPAVPPEPDEIQAFEDWVKAGTPRNATSCTDDVPSSGGGGPAPDAAAVTLVCTSGKTWLPDGGTGELMYPGRACLTCHQQNGGPNLRVAGTVYPTLHESNDCIGSGPPPKLTVTVVEGAGRTFTMDVNASGNFFLPTRTKPPPRPPFKASVSDGTKTRAMSGSVTSGDCNSCHTDTGRNGAPGRILAP